MRMQYIAALALALTLLHLQTTVAQNFNAANLTSENKQIYVNFGLDPAVELTLGYMHGVDCCGFKTTVGYDLTIPVGDFDFHDLRFRWWTLTPIVQLENWQVMGQVGMIGRTTQNDVYNGFNIGMDLGLHAGYYREGWHAAIEGGYDKSLLTHVSHRDWYTENFYPDAVDGWYLDTGGIWRVGLTTGVKFDDTELNLRMGVRHLGGDGQLLPPGYITLGVSQAIN